MNTVRSIERRMFSRRETDRQGEVVNMPVAGAPEKVEWSGVWSGYVISIGVALLLMFLVLGLGLSSVNPVDANSWKSAAAGTGIWVGICFLIATFIGGWVAGRSPASTRRIGLLKGVTMWGLLMVSAIALGALLAGTALTTASSIASSPTAAQAATSVAGSTSDLPTVLQNNGIQLSAAQTTALQARLAAGDRTGAASTLARDANLPNARATAIINQVNANSPLAGVSGGQVASTAKTVAARASWAGFWFALITLICAAVGGVIGGGGLRRFRTRQSAPVAAA